jgi:hypothetical protein
VKQTCLGLMLVVCSALIVGVGACGDKESTTSSSPVQPGTSQTLTQGTSSTETHGGAAPSSGTRGASTTTTAASTSDSVEMGEPPLDLTLARYEETDPHLIWEGDWKTWIGSGYSGGSGACGEYQLKSAVTIKFTGTNISWIGSTGEYRGVAEVIVDGGFPQFVDLYGPDRDQVRVWDSVWESGTLAFGSHKVRIECTGNYPPGVIRIVLVDAFDVIGTLDY